MDSFVISDTINGGDCEYVLKTTNSIYERKIVFSFFRKGNLVNSESKTHENGVDEQTLYEEVRKFHESHKTRIETLIALSSRLKDSDNANAKTLLGRVFLKNEMLDEAIAEFESAVKLDPNHSGALYYLGKAYLESGLHQKALEALKKAVKLSPRFADYRLELGIAHFNLKQCQGAATEFKAALEINPYYGKAAYYLAATYVLNAITREDYNLMKNMLGDTLEQLQKAAALDPNFCDEHFERGELFLREDENEKALDEFKLSLARLQDRSDKDFVLDFYLRFLHNERDFDIEVIWQHIGRLEELKQKYQNHADIYNDLGIAYSILGKCLNIQATESFEMAVSINPKFESAKRNIKLAKYDSKGIDLFIKAITK